MHRTRTEFPVYHYPTEEIGKPSKKLKPVKKLDDAMDVVRCVGATFFPPIGEMTKKERLERSLPDAIKMHNAVKASPEDKARIWIARQEAIRDYENKEAINNIGSWRDAIYEKGRIKSQKRI